MQQKQLGQIIRELRQLAGLSQQELANGICSQAQISKLEKGSEFPYSNTLYEISKRLGVDMNYFFENMNTPRLDYVDEVKGLIRRYVRQRDYESVAFMIEKEKTSPLFQSASNKQFLIWHEGICTYHLTKDKQKAIEILKEAIQLTRQGQNFYKENEIEILSSIAIIYDSENEYDEAIISFKKALQHLSQLPQIKDHHIKVRILYGVSRTYGRSCNYQEAIQFALKGVKQCISNESMYLLGELYYMVGYSMAQLRREKEAVEYLNKAILIFEISSNQQLINMVKRELDKIAFKI
ncbi:helix-turn-helix domain-containing protein [Metabacillus iocasae]|uniref:Transcriptional regulator with XRE-family HTH domain n=1 Tax=Priestia iocasae TaxID=2291674 RepID=A0ABS2QUG0_9BACI|nr:helix-turn-helix domain-containing protein [Metabacillus iocasae]MBM7703106.1 transcriptional regulator with XRE-family HTH domain [Metabacillus iocasae]